MKQGFLLHTSLIAASCLLPFLWSENILTSNYTLQLCGALIILYTVSKKVLLATYHNFDPNILTILATNAITQLLILSTGGASSPLFFLYYFLIFAFALIYESYQSFTIAICTATIYLVKTNFEFDILTLANLFSLLLISPLAQSFAKIMIKNLEAEGKISLLKDNIKKEETDSLLWLATEAKPTINTVINSVTDLIIFLNSSRNNIQFPKSFLDKIKSIQIDLLTLYSSSEDLEDTIKESSDNKNI